MGGNFGWNIKKYNFMNYQVSPKKAPCLLEHNSNTKSSIFKMSDSDSDTKIVEICCKLSEIHVFEIEHSKFISQTTTIFECSIVRLVASFKMISYLSEECPGRFISRMGALEWPPRSPELAI